MCGYAMLNLLLPSRTLYYNNTFLAIRISCMTTAEEKSDKFTKTTLA